MDRHYFVNRLDLNDYLVFHNKVCSKPDLQVDGFVSDGNRLLPNRPKPALLQFTSQSRLINRLKQPRPQRRMYPKRRIHNLPGNTILIHTI